VDESWEGREDMKEARDDFSNNMSREKNVYPKTEPTPAGTTQLW